MGVNSKRLLDKIDELLDNGLISNSRNLIPEDIFDELKQLTHTINLKFKIIQLILKIIPEINFFVLEKFRDIKTQDPNFKFTMNCDGLNFTFSDKENFLVSVNLFIESIFSNLISIHDCVLSIIEIVYNIPPSRSFNNHFDQVSQLRRKTLTSNLINVLENLWQSNVHNWFKTMRDIRNALIHKSLTNIAEIPTRTPLNMYQGYKGTANLIFNSTFFPASSNDSDREMNKFCNETFKKMQDFVENVFGEFLKDLNHYDRLPV
ncbi:MAG: Cthe_2314 family HEPN domain-containing protein [Promethearchaeota archaeon]